MVRPSPVPPGRRCSRAPQVQTPAQRRANNRYRAREEQKMGTYRAPKADREERDKAKASRKFLKPTLSQWWICKCGAEGERAGC